MTQTESGVLCPGCGRGKTSIVAIMPLIGRDAKAPIHGRMPAKAAMVEAGRYAVCQRCYERQWADVYGDQLGGITHKQYLAKQASGDLV